MSLKGKSGAAAAVLAAVFSLALFCSGCGDVFRPVATPLPQPPGDPQRAAHALVVSSNGSNPGTAVVIDATGDTNVGVFSVGRNPVHASSVTGINYVVNHDDDSVAAFTLLGVGNRPNIISLPAGATPANPVFVAVALNRVFVAEFGRGKVAVIDPGSNSVTTEVCSTPTTGTVPCEVGSGPVALVATPDGTKLYCLNETDGTVSVILPATNQVVASIKVGASPVLGAVSSDGSRVFVVNQGDSTVSVIDTTTNTVIQPNNPLPVGAGPNYITYQASLNRFYVTSPSDKSLSIINNNVDQNQCALTPGLCVQKVSLAGAPCNAQHPISVTALADGTRVYVADDATNSVCVLNTTSNTFTKRICLVNDSTDPASPCPGGITPPAPVFIASDPDSRRVFTANSGSGDVSLIQTANDTTVKRSDGTPLTIATGGTPTFIAITP
jgi:YVTN family beta-propeller protein